VHARGGLAGHEFGAAAPGEVASEFLVPVILELLDLVRRPPLWHADQRIGDRAFGIIIELPEQRDILFSEVNHTSIIFLNRHVERSWPRSLAVTIPASLNAPTCLFVLHN
jgi:hypothetical protein